MKFKFTDKRCEDFAYCPIKTADECQAVAKALRLPDFARARKQSNNRKVGGCYLNSREKLYFNSFNSKARSLRDEIILCKPCKTVQIACAPPTTTTTTTPCNDEDSDGICRRADTCPLDPANDGDNDKICGDVDRCPLDPENDVDRDNLCGNVDKCPADAANDEDK